MRELHDLLREGVAIQYDREESIMMVWIPDRTVGTLMRIMELLGDCFGIDPSDVEVHPTTVKTKHKLRLEFPYSFAGPDVTTAEDHACDHTELQDDVTTWIDLTDKMVYCVRDGELRLGWKKDGKVSPAIRVPMDKVRELYDRLPEEATTSDVRRIAGEMGLNVTGFETYIMRVMARRVEFGGEVIKEGKMLKLVKDTQYLREENLRKLRQEAEVIGTPWEV